MKWCDEQIRRYPFAKVLDNFQRHLIVEHGGTVSLEKKKLTTQTVGQFNASFLTHTAH